MAFIDNDLQRIRRSKKMMLWFAMISMAMSFAGLTSAYIVSKSRPDWLVNFVIPSAFYYSTVAVVLSSITMYFARNAVQNQEHSRGMMLLATTWILGAVFVIFQFIGFSEFISQGFFFTGGESTITTSFVYLIVLLHLAHLFSGMIALSVVIYNHYKQKYINGQTLGIELAETFWHFVDFLWLYLFLFFIFVR